MASPELQRLWKLAQVDHSIEAIKRRAAHLDVGATITAEIKALEERDAVVGGEARALRAELTDLELQQKGVDDKLKKVDREIYGGKLVNPREAENLEKEIAALKKQRGDGDVRMLELWELLPPAEKAAEDIAAQIAAKKRELADRRKQALQEKADLEAAYKQSAPKRAELAATLKDRALLGRYDQIRQRHAGVGMAEVTKRNNCGACGTHLPERTLQLLKDDKVVSCEACHRILYSSEGII